MVSNYCLTIIHQLFIDSLSLFRSFSILSVLIIVPKLSSDFLPLHPFLIQILFTSCPSKKKKQPLKLVYLETSVRIRAKLQLHFN